MIVGLAEMLGGGGYFPYPLTYSVLLQVKMSIIFAKNLNSKNLKWFLTLVFYCWLARGDGRSAFLFSFSSTC